MPIYIQRHPNPQTLLSRVISEECPAGYEASTEEDSDAWVAQQIANGWEPVPLPAEPPRFRPVTPRQFRLALLGIGISPSAISAMLAGNESALIEWEFAQEVRRDHPLVESLRLALGKNPEEVDAVFDTAANL
jgi:hypothetical protein